MTPHDRSKLARIVAYGIFQGQDQATIEARLLDYASALSPEDVATAMQEGIRARAAGVLLSSGESDLAGAALLAMHDAGAVQFQVVASYGTSATGDPQWRNVVADVPAGATPGEILTAVEDAIEASTKTEGTDPAAYVPGLLDIIYVAPLMGG